MKMDFEYDQSSGGCHCDMPEERAEYRGFTIRAVVDQSPTNPFDDYEGEPPILVYNDGRLISYGLGDSLPTLELDEIKANAAEILRHLGYSIRNALVMLEPMDDDEYADADGLKCPYCRSTRVVEGEEITNESRCDSCGKTWHEKYPLIGGIA